MYFRLVYFGYIITSIGIIKGVSGQTLEDIRKLKKALFVDQSYDVKVRPIQNQSNFKLYIAAHTDFLKTNVTCATIFNIWACNIRSENTL